MMKMAAIISLKMCVFLLQSLWFPLVTGDCLQCRKCLAQMGIDHDEFLQITTPQGLTSDRSMTSQAADTTIQMNSGEVLQITTPQGLTSDRSMTSQAADTTIQMNSGEGDVPSEGDSLDCSPENQEFGQQLRELFPDDVTHPPLQCYHECDPCIESARDCGGGPSEPQGQHQLDRQFPGLLRAMDQLPALPKPMPQPCFWGRCGPCCQPILEYEEHTQYFDNQGQTWYPVWYQNPWSRAPAARQFYEHVTCRKGFHCRVCEPGKTRKTVLVTTLRGHPVYGHFFLPLLAGFDNTRFLHIPKPSYCNCLN